VVAIGALVAISIVLAFTLAANKPLDENKVDEELKIISRSEWKANENDSRPLINDLYIPIQRIVLAGLTSETCVDGVKKILNLVNIRLIHGHF
jgi:hypothetical protein